MEIRITKEKFETIRLLMKCCEEHDGSAIRITNDKPNPSFDRHCPKQETRK